MWVRCLMTKHQQIIVLCIMLILFIISIWNLLQTTFKVQTFCSLEIGYTILIIKVDGNLILESVASVCSFCLDNINGCVVFQLVVDFWYEESSRNFERRVKDYAVLVHTLLSAGTLYHDRNIPIWLYYEHFAITSFVSYDACWQCLWL